MIKSLAFLVAIGGLMSSPPTFASRTTEDGKKAAKLPAVASPKAAIHLVHELLDADSSSIGVTPAGCYAIHVKTRDDGIYLAHITERPGKTCSIWYGQSFRPFSMEIHPTSGAVTLIDFLGEPRQVQMFPIEDDPDMPTDLTQWSLEGTTKRWADTDQCSLRFANPAFEKVTAYSLGMNARKGTRVLTVSYYVDVFGGGPPVSNKTRATLSLRTQKETLVSYAAALKPLSEGHVQTAHDVSFQLALNEREAPMFLDALAHATKVAPSLDQKEQPSLDLTVDGGFTPEFNPDANAKVAAAFRRCLGVIWK